MPKLSRYNHIQPWRNGSHLAFNARSGAVALLDSANYATYQALAKKLQANWSGPLSSEEEQLLKQMQYGMFVCDDDFSEVEWLKFEHNKARYDESIIGMVIAPTMACNMACSYCFEQNKKGRMSEQTIQSVIDFVAKRAGSLKGLDLTWFGGEPLLAMDIIARLSTAIIELGKSKGFEYESSVVTNGYLLTPEVVDQLSSFHCRQVQVTLDGPSHMHNRKRPLKNGKPSFDTIIKNIQYAATKIGVSVRVNVDKSYTIETIRELIAELKQADLQNKVWINFGMLEASTSVCSNITETCYAADEFSKVEAEYFALLLNEGFRIQKLPAPTSVFCMAQQTGCFLIDHDGDLYRCFNHVGDKSRAAGHIEAEINYRHPEFNRLFQFDPFENTECRACNLLPVCMGSCPERRIKSNGDAGKVCDSWKYNLEPMLEIIALARQQAAASTATATQEKS